METKLYVGNMSYDTTEEELRNLFAQAGTVVTVDVIMDRETRRPKGFAFITMGSQPEAEKAITMFNAKDFNGRALTVNVARPREERPAGGGGAGRGGYGDRGGNRGGSGGRSGGNSRGGGGGYNSRY